MPSVSSAGSNQFTSFGARIPTGTNAPATSQQGGIMRIRAGQPLPKGMDALLTPQDMKQLYEKGYLDVQRNFTTMESNEGLLTLTSKLAAALVGPSRSVGAIQIDPLFLEMIKDPNAEVGFGYTRVRNETLRVLPSPAADPSPPEPRPVEVPEFVPGGSIAPTTPTPSSRTPNFTNPEEEPVVNNGQNIYSIAVTAGYVGKNDGQHFENTLDSTMEGSLREAFGFLSSMKPEQRDYVNAHIVVMFTGDMRHQNGYDQANGILNSNLNARTQWASRRIDTSHMTNNVNFEANQRTGSHQYHFFSTQHKSIPLSGEMLAQYAQITGQTDKDPGTLTGAYTNKTPPTMYDLSVAVNQNMTLGDDVAIPEAQNNQAQLQQKYGELYQTVTGQALPENFDFKQASMEDLYTLQILSDGLALNQRDASKGISRDQIAQVISHQNGKLTLQDTGAARTIISGVTGLPQGGESMTTSELVACHRMNLESNFIPPGGAGFQFTQSDTNQVHEIIAGKYGTEKVNDGMRLNENNFSELSGSAFEHDHNIQNQNATYNRSGPHRTTRSTTDLSSGTVAGGMQKRELAQPDSVAQGILNNLERAVSTDNMSTGYSRRGTDAQFQALENHINTLADENPNKEILSHELSRLRGLDRATRGQYVQRGSVNNGDTSGVTPRNLSQTIVNNIKELGQPGLGDGYSQGSSLIQGQIEQLQATDTPLNSVTVDGFQKVSNGRETRIVREGTTIAGFNPTGESVTLADWATPPGLLKQAAESVAQQPIYTASELEKTAKENIAGLTTLLKNTQELPFSPQAATALMAAIDRDIQALKQIPGTEQTVSELENTRKDLQTAIEDQTQVYNRSQNLSGISPENTYISSLNGALDGFRDNVRAALADGKISHTEKASMQTFVNDASRNTVAMLSSRNVPGITGGTPAEQLSSVTQESLVQAGFNLTEANEVMGVIDRLQFAQASLNITSEGVHAAGLYESVHQLNRRLDDFEQVEVLKTAFRGEMQNLAKQGDGQQFLETVGMIYGLPREGAENAASELLDMARNGQIPIPPNIGFVDRDQLGGANGAYIEQGQNGEPVILVARDLMNNPGVMRDVFFEEMFHHLESHMNIPDSEGDEGQVGATIMAERRRNPNATTEQLRTAGEAVRMEANHIEPSVASVDPDDAEFISPDRGTLNRNIVDERGNVIARAGSNIEFSAHATTPPSGTQTTPIPGRASINYNGEPNVNLNVQSLNPHQSNVRSNYQAAIASAVNGALRNSGAPAELNITASSVQLDNSGNFTGLKIGNQNVSVQDLAHHVVSQRGGTPDEAQLVAEVLGQAIQNQNPIYDRGIGRDQSQHSENFNPSVPVRNNIQDPAVAADVNRVIGQLHSQGASPADIHREVENYLINNHGYSQADAYNAVTPNTVNAVYDTEQGTAGKLMNTVMDNLGTGLMSLGKSMNDMAEMIKATVAKFFGEVAMRLQQADPNKVTAYDVVYGEGGWHGNDTDVARGRPDDYGRLQVNQTLDRTMNPNKPYSTNPNAKPNYLQDDAVTEQGEARLRQALRLEPNDPLPAAMPSDQELKARGLTDEQIGSAKRAWNATHTPTTAVVGQASDSFRSPQYRGTLGLPRH